MHYVNFSDNPLLPGEDVHPEEGEDSVQRGEDLFGDVVGGIEAEGGVGQDLLGLPDQLYEGQPRASIHDDVGYTFPSTWFSSTVLSQGLPTKQGVSFRR